MSRKDYVLIAEAIKQTSMSDKIRAELVDNLSRRMWADNTSFDRRKFEDAAGIKTKEPA